MYDPQPYRIAPDELFQIPPESPPGEDVDLLDVETATAWAPGAGGEGPQLWEDDEEEGDSLSSSGSGDEAASSRMGSFRLSEEVRSIHRPYTGPSMLAL